MLDLLRLMKHIFGFNIDINHIIVLFRGWWLEPIRGEQPNNKQCSDAHHRVVFIDFLYTHLCSLNLFNVLLLRQLSFSFSLSFFRFFSRLNLSGPRFPLNTLGFFSLKSLLPLDLPLFKLYFSLSQLCQSLLFVFLLLFDVYAFEPARLCLRCLSLLLFFAELLLFKLVVASFLSFSEGLLLAFFLQLGLSLLSELFLAFCFCLLCHIFPLLLVVAPFFRSSVPPEYIVVLFVNRWGLFLSEGLLLDREDLLDIVQLCEGLIDLGCLLLAYLLLLG